MTVLRFKVTKKDLENVANGDSIIKCWTVSGIGIDISLELGEE